MITGTELSGRDWCSSDRQSQDPRSHRRSPVLL